MTKLTILVGLVISTMLITASNTSRSSSEEIEIRRKEIIKAIQEQSGYPDGFFKETKALYESESQLKNEIQSSNLAEVEYFQSGVASYYGKEWNGRRTANGEIFNTYELTAAHKTLPFGTKVKVTNLLNGKFVVVRITDRGPFIKGRVIDLSTAAFSSIESTFNGIAKVKLEILK